MLSRAALHYARRSIRQPQLLACRLESTGGKSKSVASSQAPPEPEPVFLEENYVRDTGFTLDFFRRFLKYSAIGLLTAGVTTWTAFEGAHQWVEKVELSPETDPEAIKWEWDVEAERWTGGALGGTDPALGFTGRHAVRSAWIAQNWGTGSNGSVIGSKAFTGRGGSGAGGLNMVDAALEYTQNFINVAIQAALKSSSSGKLRPETMTELLQRHANVMERMGTKDALYEGRSEFERVWESLPGNGIDAARVALKLGDVNQRLGDSEDALLWWARTLQLVQNRGSDSVVAPPLIPEIPPSSPLAQRTLISTLVSLSAFYATSGQLRQAHAVEEASLNLLRSIRQPESFETSSPPQALHALYILHRSSLLSIHLAEVLYALRTKQATSMQWLSRAAESSERVAFQLTGLPLIHPDAPQSRIPHPPSSETPLIPAYSKSVSMKRPARSLLRDARRSAAEAWSLMGLLAEASEAPGSMEKALECYERALGWAGVAADRAGGIGKPGEGTLESEWKVLWNNYVRARNSVKKVEQN